jgi:hypothetical protein
MAKRTNFGFNKRQKEKQKAEKAALKREKRLERKSAEEAGEITPENDPMIAPIDPADLGLKD